ncbi:hypothetical protein G4Y79_04335 [Phototrophicus methaneseepsis]|uniref:Uncharacterized protein n=1 Tax=Phototrophicus methaneseepsis TaxID=2710758 RepID=A0A7S8EAY0_9CHLR|nr:hypothetical protein [Phototrophicus methaneseepsis]QPC83617.1 hypothetical protein G4Y79_04335 [Phototrophicus methaneseepsis]
MDELQHTGELQHDEPRYMDEDGAIYSAEIVPPEEDRYGARYHVDLVRTSTDEADMLHEQRLMVGQYGSWMEAEEQLYLVEDALAEAGLDGLGEDLERLKQQSLQRADIDLTEGASDTDSAREGTDRSLDVPHYSVDAISANGDSFLNVVKSWGEDNYEQLTIPQPDWDMAQEAASLASDLISKDQLEAAMHLVEDQGIAAGVMDPEREDPRLFQQGPPDPFATLREEEIDDDLARYGVTWRESQAWESEWQPDVLGPLARSTEPVPYWRLEALPVHDLEGEPLGHALHIVVYDGVQHDPETVGSPPIVDDEPFRMLEMAHFETTEAADKFGKEFNGYLMPGLLEGPELAEEVARLEGHPVEWKTLDGQELDDYCDLKLTLTRDPADWQPYNPNAERDARIEAEGLYTDPIHQFTTFEEEDDDPKVEPATPDFDL